MVPLGGLNHPTEVLLRGGFALYSQCFLSLATETLLSTCNLKPARRSMKSDFLLETFGNIEVFVLFGVF